MREGGEAFGSAARLARIAREEQDERLLARAVEAGLLSVDEAEDVRAEAGRQEASVIDVALARGWLTPAQRDRLETEEASDLFVGATPQPLPPEAAAAATDPQRCLRDHVLTALLGIGGTGEVWKAWDRRLGRWVAVKMAKGALDSPSGRERFTREALATARLAHPHIVPIYQVGTERGRPYLVMPFIDGRSLDGARLSATDAMGVIQTVARAVHEAHAAGIVHRDLKPGNLMRDRAGRIFVLDFGLAFLREETSSRLTRPGEVLGTASYMSPEQARGDHAVPGAATDIYGLGATLYALCTGRAPFVGDSFTTVVAQVIAAEPAPPRTLQPSVPAALEAVIARAMAKDPALRYPTAAALAEDLERLARGDRPVVARRRRVPQRWWWATAMVGAVVVTLMAVRSAERRREARALAALRAVGALSLETALRLRRAGDTAGMRQVLPRLLDAYRALEAPDAEAEFLVGRIQRALFDETAALAHQQRALAIDPAYAPALYERAVLLSRRYGEMLDEATVDLTRDRGGVPVTVEEAERLRPRLGELRAQVIADGERLRRMVPTGAQADAAEGLLAYRRRRLDEARARLAAAVAADPALEVAWEILARAEAEAGRQADAEAVLERAIALDRGYAPYFVLRCGLRRGTRPADAVADGVTAARLDPGDQAGRLCAAGTHIEQAHHRFMRGEDPAAELDGAVELLRTALAVRPTPAVWISLGVVERYRTLSPETTTAVATEALARSEAAFDRAIALDGGQAEAWTGRGRTRARRMRLAIERGEAPDADLERARADYDQAAALAPHLGTPRLWKGDLLALAALWATTRGEHAEALALFARADEELNEGVRRRDDAWARLVRGTARSWHAWALARANRDPAATAAAARADLSDAVARLPPIYPEPRVRRALAALYARHERTALHAARDDVERALRDAPGWVDGLLVRAALADGAGDRAAAARDRAEARRRAPDYTQRVLARPARLPF